MSCPLLNGDIRRVAILLLEAVERRFLCESETGAYIEPGTVLRYVGTRRMVDGSRNFVVTDPVIFVAYPFVDLAPSRHGHGLNERDEYYPRTLLQNLYGFDMVTSRDKYQVIHKVSTGIPTSDTLLAGQLWCLLIGSGILITVSNRSSDTMLGNTIERRTDYFRQPLRIEIIDNNSHRHNVIISSKTPWVEFFRHVMLTVHGNLIDIMYYELVDTENEVLTAERWVELVKSAKKLRLRFYLVERKATASRSSSRSSRRSSQSGIKQFISDFINHNTRYDSKSSSLLRQQDGYDGGSSSSGRSLERSPTPARSRSQPDQASSVEKKDSGPPAEHKRSQPTIGKEPDLGDMTLSYSFQSTLTLTSSNKDLLKHDHHFKDGEKFPEQEQRETFIIEKREDASYHPDNREQEMPATDAVPNETSTKKKMILKAIRREFPSNIADQAMINQPTTPTTCQLKRRLQLQLTKKLQ